MEGSILDCLFRNARLTPDLIAFVVLGDGDAVEKEMTYAELLSEVEKLASVLAGQRLENDRALLFYRQPLEFIIAFLACQYTGIIPIPAPYSRGTKQSYRTLAILSDARPAMVLCMEDTVGILERTLLEYPGRTTIIATDNRPAPAGSPFEGTVVYNRIAFIQYTSGSTAMPKGVVVTHDNVFDNQKMIQSAFGCNGDSLIFSWLPFYHDMGLIGNILHTIHIGCSCILMSPVQFIQSPIKWLRGISKYQVTHSGGPNFAYDLCVNKITPADAADLDLSSWKVAYNGSEPVRANTIRDFSDHFQVAGFERRSFFPCYGLAEATLLVSGHKDEAAAPLIITKEDAKPIVSSGKIATGMKIKILLDESLTECVELQEGEICISGDSVTSGYWNKTNPDAFHRLGDDLFFRTGDMGFLYKGELFINGRIKEMIIIRGRNFYPADIEELVSRCHKAIEINSVAAFSIIDQEEKLVIAAEIKRSFVNNRGAEEVIHSINHEIALAFELAPFDILLIDPLSLPRTTSGKLQRTKCREMYTSGSFRVIESRLHLVEVTNNIQADHQLAQKAMMERTYSAIEQYLIRLIEKKTGYLRKEADGFDLIELAQMGIDSIQAMELINTINSDLQINMEVSTVFREGTVSGLTRSIENTLWLKHDHTTGEEIVL